MGVLCLDNDIFRQHLSRTQYLEIKVWTCLNAHLTTRRLNSGIVSRGSRYLEYNTRLHPLQAVQLHRPSINSTTYSLQDQLSTKYQLSSRPHSFLLRSKYTPDPHQTPNWEGGNSHPFMRPTSLPRRFARLEGKFAPLRLHFSLSPVPLCSFSSVRVEMR